MSVEIDNEEDDENKVIMSGPMLDKHGKPCWHGYVLKNKIRFEFETYGSEPDQANVEAIESIDSSEFHKIYEHFKFPTDIPIWRVLEELSMTHRGGEFKEWARSDAIELKKEFVWWSFDDD